MRFQAYLNVSVSLITNYDGSLPLSHYLKQYFTLHKKHGSKDRKYISDICYCFYRLGHALKEAPVEERLRVALILCSVNLNEWESLFDHAWKPLPGLARDLRIAWIQKAYPSFKVNEIFPWPAELSEGMNHLSFCRSFLSQPDLFLRLRTGYEATAKRKLEQASIFFKAITPTCLALNNASKIDQLIELNKEAVIQDYNSQRVGEFFRLPATIHNRLPRVWDCCCASGGKSILATDILPPFDLTVSDIRKSILHNLHKRFKQAGIRNYKSFTADLSLEDLPVKHSPFDLIIADLPCSGSGTWSRTPEELFFFEKSKIGQYAELQKSIISNLIPHLKKGGRLVYMTCSVFKKENEEISRLLERQFNLRIGKEALLTGYEHQADSMFAADFQL